MKEYPYIGKANGSGNLYVVYSNTCGYGLHDNNYHQQLNTRMFEDVTREYLEDKIIKVLSPEHSRYLQKIAFRYGFRWYFAGEEVQHTEKPYLYFYPDNDITFSKEKDIDRKEIFIPLPESDIEFKVGDHVSLRYKHDSNVTDYSGELLYLSDNHIIIKDEDGCEVRKSRHNYDIEEASSVLLKSLKFDIQTSIDRGDTAYGTAYNLLQEYSITKKPQ